MWNIDIKLSLKTSWIALHYTYIFTWTTSKCVNQIRTLFCWVELNLSFIYRLGKEITRNIEIIFVTNLVGVILGISSWARNRNAATNVIKVSFGTENTIWKRRSSTSITSFMTRIASKAWRSYCTVTTLHSILDRFLAYAFSSNKS